MGRTALSREELRGEGVGLERDCRAATAGTEEGEAAPEAEDGEAGGGSSPAAELSEYVACQRKRESGGNDGRWKANRRFPTAPKEDPRRGHFYRAKTGDISNEV